MEKVIPLGEELVFQTTAKYERDSGFILLTNLRILWTKDQLKSHANIPIVEIDKQRISQQQKPTSVPLLQFLLKNQKTFAFEFICNEPPLAWANRDKFSKLVQGFAAQFTNGANGSSLHNSTPSPTGPSPSVTNPVKPIPKPSLSESEALQRASLLANNKELGSLYEQLVQTGTITDDEFWESRKAMLQNESLNVNNQPKGIPSALLADVRPTAANSNTVQYKLTPATIHQIFIMYPNVQKLYNEVVPTKMSEKEFWTNYFQSLRMYREGRVSTISTQKADDIFMKVASEQEKDQQDPIIIKRKLKDVDPTVDISADDPQLSQGYGQVVDPNQRPTKMQKHLSLLRRFNRHAALVLGSTTADDSKKHKLELPELHAKIQNELKISDLQDEPAPDVVPLNIEDQHVYFDSRIGMPAEHEKSTSELIKSFQQQVSSWNPNLERATLPEAIATKILAEISTQKIVNSEMNGSLTDDTVVIPENVKKQLFQYFTTANELLRHFWSAYADVPASIVLRPNKDSVGQKVAKIVSSMSHLYTQLEELRVSATKISVVDDRMQALHLIASVIQTLDKAFERHPPDQQ